MKGEKGEPGVPGMPGMHGINGIPGLEGAIGPRGLQGERVSLYLHIAYPPTDLPRLSLCCWFCRVRRETQASESAVSLVSLASQSRVREVTLERKELKVNP